MSTPIPSMSPESGSPDLTPPDHPTVSPEVIAADLRSLGEGLQQIGGRSFMAVLAVGSVGRHHASGQSIGPASIADYDIIVVADLHSDVARVLLRHRIAQWLRDLNPRLSLPISVGIRTRRDLSRLPRTLFNYEMRNAYQVIAGSDPMGEVPPLAGELLPLIEATRLLLNRGILLWGESVGAAAGEESPGLKVRKIILALGDALLIAAGQYHWSYSERRSAALGCRDFEPFDDTDLRQWYGSALYSKLQGRPVESAGTERQELLPRLIRLHERVFQEIEERRLHRPVSNWLEYADSDVAYPAALVSSKLRRLGRAWRAFGPPRSVAFARLLASRPAEEILLRAFPALAYSGPTALGPLLPRLNGPTGSIDPQILWRHFSQAWSRSQ